MTQYVVGMDRFFKPGHVEFFIAAGATYCFIHHEALVGIRHDVPLIAHRLSHHTQPACVFRYMGTADLDFRATKSFLFCLKRFFDQLVSSICNQPPSV